MHLLSVGSKRLAIRGENRFDAFPLTQSERVSRSGREKGDRLEDTSPGAQVEHDFIRVDRIYSARKRMRDLKSLRFRDLVRVELL